MSNRNLLVTGLFTSIMIFAFPMLGQDSELDRTELIRGQQAYEQGNMLDAVNALKSFLDKKENTRKDVIAANHTLSNAYFILDSIGLAEQSIRNILNLKANFSATGTDVFKFRNALEIIRNRPKLQFGVGVAIGMPFVSIGGLYTDPFEFDNSLLISGLSNENLIDNIEGESFKSVFLSGTFSLKDPFYISTAIGINSLSFAHRDNYSQTNVKTRIINYSIPVQFSFRLPWKPKGIIPYLHTGIGINYLKSWDHHFGANDPSGFDLASFRNQLTTDWISTISGQFVIGHVLIKPGINFTMSISDRSKAMSDDLNASLMYNEPSIVNYNSKFGVLSFSIELCKQRY
ncbi:MAG: hypothetical protein JXQ90_01660 [Cyclobacteriaceae bacterium]